MKIFGYGSLLCEASLQETVPTYKTLGTACLRGYRRVFNLKSKGRINTETGTYSCVLNLQKDPHSKVCGVLYEIPESIVEALHLREEGYGMKECTFDTGEKAYAYMAEVAMDYPYLFDDPVQREYLDICLRASTKLGPAMHQNFLESTYIGDIPLLELKDKLRIK